MACNYIKARRPKSNRACDHFRKSLRTFVVSSIEEDKVSIEHHELTSYSNGEQTFIHIWNINHMGHGTTANQVKESRTLTTKPPRRVQKNTLSELCICMLGVPARHHLQTKPVHFPIILLYDMTIMKWLQIKLDRGMRKITVCIINWHAHYIIQKLFQYYVSFHSGYCSFRGSLRYHLNIHAEPTGKSYPAVYTSSIIGNGHAHNIFSVWYIVLPISPSYFVGLTLKDLQKGATDR